MGHVDGHGLAWQHLFWDGVTLGFWGGFVVGDFKCIFLLQFELKEKQQNVDGSQKMGK